MHIFSKIVAFSILYLGARAQDEDVELEDADVFYAVSTAPSPTSTSTGPTGPTGCPAAWDSKCAFFSSGYRGSPGSCLTAWVFNGFSGQASQICPGGPTCSGNPANCPFECTTSQALGDHTFCNPNGDITDPRVTCKPCGQAKSSTATSSTATSSTAATRSSTATDSTATSTTGTSASSATSPSATSTQNPWPSPTGCPPYNDPSCGFFLDDRSGKQCSWAYRISPFSGQGSTICPFILSQCTGNPNHCLYECKLSGSLGNQTFCNTEDYTGDSRIACKQCPGITRTSETNSPTASPTTSASSTSRGIIPSNTTTPLPRPTQTSEASALSASGLVIFVAALCMMFAL
ncbi:hypothetical protein TWF696_003895 [Orbilia brochopaga]|uniref:Uncharacterized protein n=1 Tax=Orbilia brochopaga TaxID=3140254 RepID=A0AAV9V665_9PEZI